MVIMNQVFPILCQYHDRCSGCSLWHLSQDQQLAYKKQGILNLLSEKNIQQEFNVDMIGLDNYRYRDRVDLIFVEGILGFFEKRTSFDKKLIDINECLILSDCLKDFFIYFRSLVEESIDELLNYKFTFRLRVSPSGQRGVWIDTGNEAVKSILASKLFLQNLLKAGISVEIGQRLKPLYLNESGELKLSKETKTFPWFETYSSSGNSLSIFSEIGAFSQPGRVTNKLLVGHVHKILDELDILEVTELFSGNGNFTLAFLSRGLKVFSYESFLGAEKNLQKSLKNFPEFSNNIVFKNINLVQKNSFDQISFDENALFFVDPPRSGLGKIVELIIHKNYQERPKFLLYVSCNPHTLVDDIARLIVGGYKIQSLTGIDQFMFSDQSEWICLLKKS